ncbi:MAG: sigma-54-dependent Fis family transcriptional regulator [Candidatus Cloacimonetes bacterium]|nr:sigma-54-dependent Fis family transcriptional regulator [Candidatus Cloacimonadota bacterium]
MEKVLLVDDNENMQFILKNLLTEEGFEFLAATNGLEALNMVQKDLPDLVLLDIRLPGMDGIEVLKKLKESEPDLLVIMITAYGDVKSAVKAIKIGAYDYITKPFDNEELILTIRKALKTHFLKKEVEMLREKLYEKEENERIMGESPAIKKVLKQVELIAPTNMSVIIQGNSGTGKEVIANLIHRRSPRCGNPFVAVDCGAIPDTLIESELFGHEKGAFTGANHRKEGVFELANTGTLFLDEITNLGIEHQVKLLRVIQERKVKRLGSTKAIAVDVRILIATNRDLLESVKNRNFREDLYHRLSEFKIFLPLLKDRKEDIPVLAKVFLQEANQELDKNINDFSNEALQLLLEYSWPGNVRELRHVIKRAVLMEKEKVLNPSVLEFESTLGVFNHKKDFMENSIKDLLDNKITLSDITRKLNNDTEKEIIRTILREVKYNKSKAAAILGIDRNTLYAKMKQLNIG